LRPFPAPSVHELPFACDRTRTYNELLKRATATVVVRHWGGNMLKRRLFTLLVLSAVSLFASPAS